MRLQRYFPFVVAVVLAGIAVAFTLKQTSSGQISSPSSASRSPAIPLSQPPTLDVANYHVARTKIDAKRVSLWSRYQHATVSSERELIVEDARLFLVSSVSENIFPYWYGTEWDFYGTTESPNKGKIACGYFVSTVLRDLGMKVERVRLAQQASENIILSLTTQDHIKRYRQTAIDKFVEDVRKWGTGLYVVGLDVHVGFILNDGQDVYFVHSSYVDPYCVVRERAADSKILASSRYRVLGRISEDDELTLKWLRGDRIATISSQ